MARPRPGGTPVERGIALHSQMRGAGEVLDASGIAASAKPCQASHRESGFRQVRHTAGTAHSLAADRWVVRQALATAGALVNQEGEALAPKCLCESSVGRPATASSERSKPPRSPAALPTCAASTAWNLIRAARWSTMMVSRADYAFAAVLAVAAARCCAASAFAEVVTCSDRRDRSRSNARARPSMRYCTVPMESVFWSAEGR